MNEKEITILIVDDSEAIRILVNAYLREGGYRVLEACNGKEGLEVCKQESIDLALLDIAMPEMDGIQATKKIRKKENNKNQHTPIIAVTASDPYHNRHIFFDAGIDDYVSKPIDPVLLMEKISRHSKIKLSTICKNFL